MTRQHSARPLRTPGGLLVLVCGLSGSLGCPAQDPGQSESTEAVDASEDTSGADDPESSAGESRGADTETASTTSGGSDAETGSTTAPSTSTGGTTTGDASASSDTDADTTDGSSWDGCDEFVMPPDCTIPEGAVLPGELRCTGLYADWESRAPRCGVQAYAPAYELWSDAAAKERYVWLPPGQTIDATQPDALRYPVGTRFWKEFHVGAPGSQKLGETRYMLKTAAGWLYTTYVWSEDGTTATQTNDGVTDLFGTGHTVPRRDDCKTCHDGRDDFVMGWDLAMLGPGATGVTLQLLHEEGWLSGLDETLLEVTIPGDELEVAALGYLHANCGVSCHNETTFAEANSSGLHLRLNTRDMGSVLTTAAVVTGINRQPGPNADYGDLPDPTLVYYDFRPLDPMRSLALARMNYRGSDTAMPPLGTHVVDPDGVAVVEAWILAMTQERGYPAPEE